MQTPKGMQQTRNLITRATLKCGAGFSLVDPRTRRTLIEFKPLVSQEGDGYVILQPFEGNDVLYQLFLSDELRDCEVSHDKLIRMFLRKLAMETSMAARLIAVSDKIDIEMASDEENVILMWLEGTCIAEFSVTGESVADVKITTSLLGSTIRIQLANIFRQVLSGL